MTVTVPTMSSCTLVGVLAVVLLVVYCQNEKTTGKSVFGKFGSVRIDWDASYKRWSQSSTWPEGIQLINNIDSPLTDAPSPRDPFNSKLPKISSFLNSNGYPYSLQSSFETMSSTKQQLVPPRRTFTWQNDDLLISVNMTSLSRPSGTRLVPPITWLSASGARVKVQQQTVPERKGSGNSPDSSMLWNDSSADSERRTFQTMETDDDSQLESQSGTRQSWSRDVESSRVSSSSSSDSGRVIEIFVRKQLAEQSLSCLRMHGFTRSDIYRMLEKGPWVLAFDISGVLPRLCANIKSELGLNQSETVHILSHCPYLIAQYHRYKGRDVGATARALVAAGYSATSLAADLRRFPSMLSAPPDRIRGWMHLLAAYGVAAGPGQFGKYIRRAPFMFNLNAPHILDDGPLSSRSSSSLSSSSSSDDLQCSTTASEYVAYDALQVLDLLWDLRVGDLDKVMRTQPSLLLTEVAALKERVNYLCHLLLQNASIVEEVGSADESCSSTAVSSMTSSSPITAAVVTASTSLNDSSVPLNFSLEYYRFYEEQNRKTAESAISDLLTIACPVAVASENGAEEGEGSVSPSLAPPGSPPLYLSSPGVQKALSGLIMTYPAVLSVEKKQMEAAVGSLMEGGLSAYEAGRLVRSCPPLLGRAAVSLSGCIYFLKQYCGLRKVDLFPFLQKHPNILCIDVSTLAPKKDYLFKSLGASPSVLKRCPVYLCYDLDKHIIPRAEFVRALGKDPLMYGLSFLINSKDKDLVYSVGSSLDVYLQFKTVFGQKWMERKLSVQGIASSGKAILNKVSSLSSDR